MKIIVAPDKFKGSLTATRAAGIIAETLQRDLPAATIVRKPMADGGDGTAEVLHASLGGKWIERTVTGPLPEQRVVARYLWLPEQQLAVIEMASASGLVLLPPHQRNPLHTTTRGTGELIGDALTRGARRVWVGVGGSATVDAGTGAAEALGWQFLDATGQHLPACGANLHRIARIVPPPAGWPTGVSLEVFCDVDNPLCGPTGAAPVFAPQKGADPATVALLADGLEHFAQLMREQLGRDVALMPRGGAAGGLAAGLAVFASAQLVPGAERIAELIGLPAAAQDAAWVITGEGCFDATSLRGKVVATVFTIARAQRARVALIAGQIRTEPPAPVVRALSLLQPGMTVAEAMTNAERLLSERVAELADHIRHSDGP
ncbi:MAG: glycerate kinase [Verrucomicrobiae bacterium]|nr:glycerate kinase [Verrucomicrobiae bacterium]